MDQSHVALVSLKLEDVGFLHYRCDRPRSLGLNMASVVKVFKLCSSHDTVALQSEDDGDMITFVFENNGQPYIYNICISIYIYFYIYIGEARDPRRLCWGLLGVNSVFVDFFLYSVSGVWYR